MSDPDILPAIHKLLHVNPMFTTYKQTAKTHNFIHRFPKPPLRQIINARVFMNRRHKRSSVNVGVADSSDENAWRRHAVDVFTCHQRDAFEEIVDFNHYWASGFAAEGSGAFAEDAEAVVSGCGL